MQPRLLLRVALLLAQHVGSQKPDPHPLVSEHNFRNRSCGYSYDHGCGEGQVCWLLVEFERGGTPKECGMRRSMEDGNPMLATLPMVGGAWREATPSRTVRACPASMCIGGNISMQCAASQAGVRCSECSSGYYSTAAGQPCLPCSGDEAGVVVAALVAVVAAAILVMSLLQYWSTVQETKWPRTARIYAVLSVLSASFAIRLRIIITLVQVMRGVAFSAQLRVPVNMKAILDTLAIIDLSVPEILPFRCVIQGNSFFLVKLLIATLIPLGVIAILGLVVLLARRCAASFVGHTCAAAAFLILFVCYNSAATLIFAFFQCSPLSGPGESGRRFLLADTTLYCDGMNGSPYAGWTDYTITMAVIWPLGVPAVLTVMLWRERGRIREQRTRASFDPTYFKEKAVAVWVLISPYRPKRFFFEVLEFLRKASLVFLPLFIEIGSQAQHSLILVALIVWWVVMALLHPYSRLGDAVLAHASNALIVWFFAASAFGQPAPDSDDEPDDGSGMMTLFILIVVFAVLFETPLFDKKAWTKARAKVHSLPKGHPVRDLCPCI